jgi:hypothetical protein
LVFEGDSDVVDEGCLLVVDGLSLFLSFWAAGTEEVSAYKSCSLVIEDVLLLSLEVSIVNKSCVCVCVNTKSCNHFSGFENGVFFTWDRR